MTLRPTLSSNKLFFWCKSNLRYLLLFFLLSSGVFASRLTIQFNTFIELMGQKYGPARVTVARNWQTMLVRTQNKPE
jgi:hypothetical protein|tara:strand:- start:192 stop:422 length:231 start_codon:yes stop_codon:yes gene_type:complete